MSGGSRIESERERESETPPSLLGSSHKTRHPSNLHPAPFDDVNDARVYGFSTRENWIREDFSAPSHHREVPRGAPEMIIQNEMDVKMLQLQRVTCMRWDLS